MIRCGIDPGAAGGIAFLGGGKFIAGFRMPYHDKIVDGRELARILELYHPEEVVVEKVAAMPPSLHGRTQGTQSAFTFGLGAGVIQGVVQSLCYPLVMISPPEWKKLSGLIGKDKRASNLLAKNLWPDADVNWDVQANNGIAEAALIARAQSAKYVKEANA
jgi:hypothetical protein